VIRTLCLGFLVIGSLCLPIYHFCFKPRIPEAKENFIKTPIFYLSLLKLPHIDIEIEKNRFSLLIDSGSDTELSFQSKALKKIHGKRFITESKYYNFKGNRYPTDVYRLEKLNIDKTLTLYNLEIRIDNEEATKIGNKLNETSNLSSWVWDQIESWTSHGKIGNGILRNFVCYFDFPNETFCIARDLKCLVKEGKYSLDQFISTSIEVAQFGPIVNIETKWGRKAFLLDTGSTRSLINQKSSHTEEESKSDLVLENFKLGSCCFVSRNISPLFSGIDGILGVDFFRQNVVCIDYLEKTAYISPVSLQAGRID